MESGHFVFFFVAVVCSFGILYSGIRLQVEFPANYAGFLPMVFIAIGALLLILSLFGCYCAAGNGNRASLLRANVVSIFLFTALTLGFGIFALRASDRKTVHVASGLGYEDYHLLDGGAWLQKWVNNDANWKKIRRRLIDLNTCDHLVQSHQTFQQFVHNDIDPFQSGCCKPPYECGYLYRNPTVWERPPTGPLTNNTDCRRWSNHKSSLCYDCSSCKASVVTKVEEVLGVAAVNFIAFASALLSLFRFSCCIFKTGQ